MKFRVFQFLIFSFGFSFPSNKVAYAIFDKTGSNRSFEYMLKECQAADVVLFGEIHNNPICHWLELNTGRELYNVKKKDLLLGAEMLEADDQIILNEYLKGLVDFKGLHREAKLWEHFETDYKPLLDLALNNKLNFIATNIPRRYASLVSKRDINSLNELDAEARQWFPPLPIEMDLNLPGYKNMNEAVRSSHGSSFVPSFMAQAQAIKDATMAYFILKNWQKGKLFFHVNGAYHSNNYEGIVWFLKRKNPELKIITISSVEQEKTEELQKENENLADFTICIQEDMTKSYRFFDSGLLKVNPLFSASSSKSISSPMTNMACFLSIKIRIPLSSYSSSVLPFLSNPKI
jgi:uncharacterized iron-regulated protein